MPNSSAKRAALSPSRLCTVTTDAPSQLCRSGTTLREIVPVPIAAHRCGLLSRTTTTGDLPQPCQARFRLPGERLPVDGDQPEGGLPVTPFKVVERTPVQIATHIDTVLDRGGQVIQRCGCVGDPALVVGCC